MSYFIQLSALFFLGLVIESLLLLKSKIGKIELLIIGFCIILGLVVGFYGVKGDYSQSNLSGGVVLASVVFATTFAWIFMSRILISINETTLLAWNLVFLYLYFQNFSQLNTITVIILILSIATLINSFLRVKINAFWKALFYVWFLIILVYFAISQFNLKSLAFLNEHEDVNAIGRLTAFFTGMAFFYITVNVWYLYRLIPIPAKNQTWKARIYEWKEDMHLIVSKYSDEQISYAKNSLILVAISGLLLINYKFKFLTDSSIVIMSISIVSFITSRKISSENKI